MAILDPAANFGKVTVNQGYDSAATSIALVPTDPNLGQLDDPSSAGAYNVVWWNATTYADPADDPNREIVRVTAKNAAQLTITRAQESTTATNKNTTGATYKIQVCPTQKFRDDIVDAAIDVGSDWGLVTEYGAVGDGSADDKAAFSAAAAVLTHIVIPNGTYKISSNITFGSGITLEFWESANLSIDTGVTVTISGNVLAENWQIFSGSGTYSLSARCPIRYTRWDGTATDQVEFGTDAAFDSGKLLYGGDTVVESGSLDVSSTGIKTCTIAHGLGSTPDEKQITLTAYRSSGSNVFEINGMYILSVDATNINVQFNVTTAAATTNAVVAARVHH
jgi:hypothetical protein